MTTLTAYMMANPAAAARLTRRLEPLRERGLAVRDCAVVQWEHDERQPSAWQTESMNDRQALSGAFWGLLFAHLFLIPLSHRQAAQQPWEGDHTLDHVGIDHTQLHTIRQLVTPGSSTLLVLSDSHPDAGTDSAEDQVALAMDRLLSATGETSYRTTAIVLSPAQTGRLYTGFARHPRASAEPTATEGAGR